MRPEPFSEAIAIAKVSVKWGTGWKRIRSGPIDSSDVALYSSSRKAFSIRSSLPHAPTTRRKVSVAPGGACSQGRAGLSVPGQRSTGTGCWRGA